ncbi:MAG: complex I subunit 1 family protein [Aquihabitans sp.]
MIVAADPLLSGDIGLAVVLIVLAKAAITLGICLVATMLMIWFERKIISDLQNRIGPNRAGPWGILQTLADGLKVILKEDLVPSKSDKWIFRLAPILTMVPAFITFGLVPLGGDFSNGNSGQVEIFGHTTLLQLANPDAGVLVILAMSSIAIYGIMLAGWASGSKYPLLGSVRASAQMVSYEAALGLSILAVVLTTSNNDLGIGTLTTNGIVSAQVPWGWNLWVTGLVPFVVFLLAATAELNRPPFDLVEAEQELVGSFQTEYSGFRFAIFYLAEFLNAITMAAIIVTLFLGGPGGPAIIGPAWVWGFVWFFVKLVAVLYAFVWTRASVPRVRYDQLMDLGWKVLIPLSVGWLLLLVAIRVGDDAGWNPIAVVAGAAVGLAAGYGLLAAAIKASHRNRVAELLDKPEGALD